MAQVLDTLYVDIITRNFGQVSQQIRGVTAQLRQAHTGAQLLDRSVGTSAATMANLGRAATASGASLGVLAAGAVGVGASLAGIAAGVALVKHGFEGTTELARFQFALTQISREAVGLFVPVMNQAARSAWAVLDVFRNSPDLQAAIQVGLVTPMVLFVKGLESAVKLGLVLADTMAAVAAAVLRVAGVNFGGLGLLGRLADAVKQAPKQVTLNQTGEESGQQTFQRIQQAILKLSEPDDKDPVVEVLTDIDKWVQEIADTIRNAKPGVVVQAEQLARQAAAAPGVAAGGIQGAIVTALSDPLAAPGRALAGLGMLFGR